jgi:BirA family biotin operon repressor/biotin-[acetyl-CoA-carboxylase] ligase
VRCEADRLASFAADLARLDALRGMRVDVAGARGVAEGIDAEGRLSVRGDDGKLTAVVSGEVAMDERGGLVGATSPSLARLGG